MAPTQGAKPGHDRKTNPCLGGQLGVKDLPQQHIGMWSEALARTFAVFKL